MKILDFINRFIYIQVILNKRSININKGQTMKLKGFSLIELMVVIVIIMVVLSIGGCFAAVGVGGCIAKKAIDNGGVKGVATTLWEGTNTVVEPSTE
jgi:prepilin-type N-terminal cleavage/methylation domain-containing protein